MDSAFDPCRFACYDKIQDLKRQELAKAARLRKAVSELSFATAAQAM